MSEKNTDLADSIQFRSVRLINGRYIAYGDKEIVGFCHYYLHKGYLTANMLKNHKCCEKECSLLQKFEEYPYWQRMAEAEKAKARNKQKAKNKKIAEAKKRAKQELLLENLKAEAQDMADYWYTPILITRIAKKTKSSYTIFYVSDCDANDWYEYRDIAFVLSKKYHSRFTLKHMKRADGHYASVSDWLSKQ